MAVSWAKGGRFVTQRRDEFFISKTSKESLVDNVFCATGPGGGINPHCSSGGFAALDTAHGLVDYVKKSAAAAGIKFTDLYMKKIHAFNPNGLVGGTFYTPTQATKAMNDKHREFYMKSLPAGTVIKSKDVSAVKLAQMLAANPIVPLPPASSPAPAAAPGRWVGGRFVTGTPAAPAAPATPATPAVSPPHRGANVISGAPASAAPASSASAHPPSDKPTVPFVQERHWETGKAEPGTLNGVDFAPAPPKFWEKTKDVDIKEPKSIGPIARVGVMITEPDGRVWICQPTNGFGNRKFTIPGGGVEKGLSNQQNALKEVWEETGLQVKITGHLGDFKDSNNQNNGRLYVGVRVGGAPWDAKPEPHIPPSRKNGSTAESEAVSLVTKERAAELLHRTDDLAQLATVAPIKVNAKSNGEMMKKLVDGLQPKAKQYEAEQKAKKQDPGSTTLHAVQELRGFNGLPAQASKADMDKLVASGTHVEMLRGIRDNWPNVGKEMAEQFRSGNHFPGFGCFGNGTYADATKGRSNVAAPHGSYAGTATLRIALPKSAKIVEQSELEKQVGQPPSNFSGKNSTGTLPHDANRQWWGIQAALAGYDAIHVDGKSPTQGSYGNINRSKTEGFYVILNRSILTVQTEDATGHVIK